MNKLLATLLLCVTLPAGAAEPAKINLLHYRFNKNVIITISNQPCPFKEISKRYPLAVIAHRSDNAGLAGCFGAKGDDIVIQWLRGDISTFPANVFLTGDSGSFAEQPKATM